MKTAKIAVRTIVLVCPECDQIVTSARGDEQLLRASEVSYRWEGLMHQTWQCSNCNKHFKLPANPFVVKGEKSA